MKINGIYGGHIYSTAGSNPFGPAIQLTPPLDSKLFKTLWSVRTLDEYTVKGYWKHLWVLSNNVDLTTQML